MNRSISREVIPMAAAAVRYGVPYSLQCAPKLEKVCPHISLFFPSEGITLYQTKQKNNNQTNKKWVCDFFRRGGYIILKNIEEQKWFEYRIILHNLIMIHLTNSVACLQLQRTSVNVVLVLLTHHRRSMGNIAYLGQNFLALSSRVKNYHYTSISIQKILLVVVNVDKRL